jgi:hypothetical protein
VRSSLHGPSWFGCPQFGVSLRPHFRIYKVLADGALQFVQSVPTLEDAKARVQELSKHWPGDYLIENKETGERLSMNTNDEK